MPIEDSRAIEDVLLENRKLRIDIAEREEELFDLRASSVAADEEQKSINSKEVQRLKSILTLKCEELEDIRRDIKRLRRDSEKSQERAREVESQLPTGREVNATTRGNDTVSRLQLSTIRDCSPNVDVSISNILIREYCYLMHLLLSPEVSIRKVDNEQQGRLLLNRYASCNELISISAHPRMYNGGEFTKNLDILLEKSAVYLLDIQMVLSLQSSSSLSSLIESLCSMTQLKCSLCTVLYEAWDIETCNDIKSFMSLCSSISHFTLFIGMLWHRHGNKLGEASALCTVISDVTAAGFVVRCSEMLDCAMSLTTAILTALPLNSYNPNGDGRTELHDLLTTSFSVSSSSALICRLLFDSEAMWRQKELLLNSFVNLLTQDSRSHLEAGISPVAEDIFIFFLKLTDQLDLMSKSATHRDQHHEKYRLAVFRNLSNLVHGRHGEYVWRNLLGLDKHDDPLEADSTCGVGRVVAVLLMSLVQILNDLGSSPPQFCFHNRREDIENTDMNLSFLLMCENVKYCCGILIGMEKYVAKTFLKKIAVRIGFSSLLDALLYRIFRCRMPPRVDGLLQLRELLDIIED